MEKKKNTPKLRFPEFTGEWEEKKLGEIAENISYGMNAPAISYDGVNKYLRITDIDESSRLFYPKPLTSPDGLIEEKFKLREGDLVFARTGASVGKSYLYKKSDGNLYFAGFLIRFSIINENPLFIFTQTLNKPFYKWVQLMSMRSGQPGINAEEYKEFPIFLTSLAEQTKIATFLTAVDEKLTQLKKKKTLLEQYKKGVMQKLFSQEFRFKDDNNQDFPDWQEKTLGEISNRVITKNKENNLNVLTISAQNGLVSQLEFFNKSVSAKDVTGYYLLDRNDFAYNKSYSNGYPMGAIKRLTRYEKGVVSTLYICFRNKTCFDNSFAEQYFETGLQNNELEKVAQEGARNHGLLNIGVSDFFKIELTIPSLPEQQKIATFLSAIDEKINYCSAQIEKMEAWKKGLLQQMFC